MQFQNIPSDILYSIYNDRLVDQNIISSISKESNKLVEDKVKQLKLIQFNTTVHQYDLLQELCNYVPLYDLTAIYFDNKEFYIDL
jgi:hypothetical protein